MNHPNNYQYKGFTYSKDGPSIEIRRTAFGCNYTTIEMTYLVDNKWMRCTSIREVKDYINNL